MNKDVYEQLEKMIYEDVFCNGENDVAEVKVEIMTEGGHKETFGFLWKK